MSVQAWVCMLGICVELCAHVCVSVCMPPAAKTSPRVAVLFEDEEEEERHHTDLDDNPQMMMGEEVKETPSNTASSEEEVSVGDVVVGEAHTARQQLAPLPLVDGAEGGKKSAPRRAHTTAPLPSSATATPSPVASPLPPTPARAPLAANNNTPTESGKRLARPYHSEAPRPSPTTSVHTPTTDASVEHRKLFRQTMLSFRGDAAHKVMHGLHSYDLHTNHEYRSAFALDAVVPDRFLRGLPGFEVSPDLPQNALAATMDLTIAAAASPRGKTHTLSHAHAHALAQAQAQAQAQHAHAHGHGTPHAHGHGTPQAQHTPVHGGVAQASAHQLAQMHAQAHAYPRHRPGPKRSPTQPQMRSPHTRSPQ